MFSGRRTRRANAHHHHHHHTTTTTTRAPRRSIFSRRQRVAVHHQKRKPTMKDKISGALTKLRGSLTRRPGLKAAGTRRMHGTDGRGSHRAGRRFF
ncbi:hypothetical protein VFPFJ_08632 [Purpureocillium lilacinum]|uniref:Uncharacterized protein n=1 Tax=Purpureocillium lilacinum TaxID=33203 RepID=A0A179GBD6_PURLI|nr:hypothetical protein VFPFJ_08632 [Purpureocillium lilacinum]KAK4089771.1 hypothetical protein Purlil1_5874 [Purpureocillium lilacinum]OAQ74721.1 hypothetical protein VFPBJ_10016 [Purpureocillium lilacinum]OAQ82829.1 hypothetical protein VFPFJ_08632 [Purpureocillium lilacinum]PWI75261.1 hypothetical protein PCL_05919 [Purpureocillium lilacinum]GJN70851.1 hypothetical protein PLICBS_004911 [Purpureocillium lilacinum]